MTYFTDAEVRQSRDLALLLKITIDHYNSTIDGKVNLAVIYTALCMIQVFILRTQKGIPTEELEDKMGSLLDEFWTMVDREALKL